MSSSGDEPAPPALLGSNDRIDPQMKLVSKRAELISAFSCKPNTSVGS